MRIARILQLGALLAFLLAAAPARAAVSASLDPAVAAPGASILVSVSGFRPGERIDRWVTAPDSASTAIDPYIYADRSGAATWSYSVPSDAMAGVYSMAARGIKSNERFNLPFEVLPGAAVVAPPTAVSPQAGPPGTSFAFRASGFQEQERVYVWTSGPNGENLPGPYDVRADRQGLATWQWTAPPDAARGSWNLIALGRDSRIQYIIPFTIQ